MHSEALFRLKRPTPVAVGMGLVALDIVINGWESESPLVSTGGSCGNVMSILAYLGWQCFPVVRIGDDLTADFIAKDLARFGVQLDFLYREGKGHTPIVIETIPVGSSARRTHFFSFTCPHCGASLPKHRAILKTGVQHLIQHVPLPSVFYFDRISRATIEMAQKYAMEGTMVVFEPSNIRNGKLLKECLRVSHIVKYSQERLGHVIDDIRDAVPFLEVETLGAYGLRFRIRANEDWPSNWEYMEAYKVDDLKDEAGCGDWCTAGIIHLLGQKGIKSLKQMEKQCIVEALNFGQALAALNCRFEGARGGMYSLHPSQFKAAVKDIIEGRKLKTKTPKNIPGIVDDLLRSICPNCQNSFKTVDLKEVMTSKKSRAGRAKRSDGGTLA